MRDFLLLGDLSDLLSKLNQLPMPVLRHPTLLLRSKLRYQIWPDLALQRQFQALKMVEFRFVCRVKRRLLGLERRKLSCTLIALCPESRGSLLFIGRQFHLTNQGSV